MLGSQGTERGISACLQDTMYFLGERENNNLVPLGAHLFPQTSLLAYCVPGPVLSPAAWERLLSGQGDWMGTQKTAAEDIHTQRRGRARERGRPPTPLLSDFTLAKVTSPYASVSSAVKWDQWSHLPPHGVVTGRTVLGTW